MSSHDSSALRVDRPTCLPVSCPGCCCCWRAICRPTPSPWQPRAGALAAQPISEPLRGGRPGGRACRAAEMPAVRAPAATALATDGCSRSHAPLLLISSALRSSVGLLDSSSCRSSRLSGWRLIDPADPRRRRPLAAAADTECPVDWCLPCRVCVQPGRSRSPGAWALYADRSTTLTISHRTRPTNRRQAMCPTESHGLAGLEINC